MARGRHPRRYAQLGGQRAAEELRELFQGVGKPLWWHVVDDHNNGLASFDNRGDAEAFAAAKRDELGENVYLVRHQSGKAGTLEKAFTVPVRKNPRKPTRKARGSQADAFYGSQAYHGYLIGSTLTGQTFIEKDGFLIAWAKNLKDAMRQIDELTATNPRKPTRKARAFIGRKIQRLAHEGMQAPRRVAAAYSLARRAGFTVPKRARKNPRQYSERDAWSVVENAALRILEQKASARVHREAEIVRLTAVEMKAQLSEGVHTNPTLAVLGNPPAQVVGTLSHRLYELRYQHAEDGKDYRHPFGPGAAVKLLADGSVWITSRKRLWKDL